VPVIKLDGLWTLRCLNHPRTATMRLSIPRQARPEFRETHRFSCLVCGYVEEYEARSPGPMADPYLESDPLVEDGAVSDHSVIAAIVQS
jgi:hypothetical protein